MKSPSEPTEANASHRDAHFRSRVEPLLAEMSTAANSTTVMISPRDIRAACTTIRMLAAEVAVICREYE